MQTHHIKSMETGQQNAPIKNMSMLNPLAWIYGVYAYIKPRVVWLTPSEADKKIEDFQQRQKDFLESLFDGIINENDKFADKIVEDAAQCQNTIDATTLDVDGFKDSVISQIKQLVQEGEITKKTVVEIIDDFKKSSMGKFSLMHKKIDEFERRRKIADLLTQEQLEKNKIKFGLFNIKIREQLNQLSISRKRFYEDRQDEIRKLATQQHNHQLWTTKSIKHIQTDLKQANEDREKELDESNKRNNKRKISIDEITQKLELELVRLQKVLNALSLNKASTNKQPNNLNGKNPKKIDSQQRRPTFVNIPTSMGTVQTRFSSKEYAGV